jgi:hypothetical protein
VAPGFLIFGLGFPITAITRDGGDTAIYRHTYIVKGESTGRADSD